MQTTVLRRAFTRISTLALLTALSLALPQGAQAKGGSGGGGGSTKAPKVVESRVTGYVTAIDYAAGTISIGASYYGSGELTVTEETSYSFIGYGSDFSDIQVGDWAEARYLFVAGAREATKISITSVSP